MADTEGSEIHTGELQEAIKVEVRPLEGRGGGLHQFVVGAAIEQCTQDGFRLTRWLLNGLQSSPYCRPVCILVLLCWQSLLLNKQWVRHQGKW